jgi:hypothetical protein
MVCHDPDIPLKGCIFYPSRQQLTGINFIFYFGTSIFQSAGISKPFLITIATNIVNVFMTLPAMWGVERFGRRRLILVGAVGMCICEFLVMLRFLVSSAIHVMLNPLPRLQLSVSPSPFITPLVRRRSWPWCVSTLPSSLPRGVPSPGSLLGKFSHWPFVLKRCRCLSRATGNLSFLY